MKRIFIGIICCAILMGLYSCKVGIKKDQATETLIKIAARNISKYVLRNNPDMIDEVKFYCTAMTEQEITQGVLDIAMDKLTEFVGADPALQSDFKDLISLIEIDMENPDFNMDYIYVALDGFLDGADLAKLYPK